MLHPLLSLRALTLMVKNPGCDRVDYLEKELDVFRLNGDEKRCARIFSAALNGMVSMDGGLKGSLPLNRLCEAFAYSRAHHERLIRLISRVYSFADYADIVALNGAGLTKDNGFPLIAEPLVNGEVVRQLLLEKLSDAKAAQQILEAFEKGLRKKTTRFVWYQYDFSAQKAVVERDGTALAVLSPVKAKAQKAINRVLLTQEWLSSEKQFSKVFDSASLFFLELYDVLRQEARP